MWIYKYPCKQNIACRHFFMNVPQRNRITRGLLSTIVRIVIHIENNIESSNGSGITQKTKPDFGFLNIHIFFVFTNLFFIFDDFFLTYPHFSARLHIKTWKFDFGWCPIYHNSQACCTTYSSQPKKKSVTPYFRNLCSELLVSI